MLNDGIDLRQACKTNDADIAVRVVGDEKFGLAYAMRPQHCLYFFPLPQGQGSLRPMFCGRARR